MRKITLKLFFLMLSASMIVSCSATSNTYRLTKNYRPDDIALYKTVVALDSTFFAAYNTCDVNLDKYSSFYADEIEFYHDNGGFMNSKKKLLTVPKNTFAGK